MHSTTNILSLGARRILAGALGITIALPFALLVALASPAPALAYVDPSVMTYTIQALAGVAVAIGAVAGVAFRRSRKWIFAKLNIDENANKTVEGDVVARGSESFDEALAAADEQAKTSGEPSANRGLDEPASTRTRILLALFASFFFAFTVFFVAPVETIAGNVSSFVFSLAETWVPIALLTLGITAVLAIVLSLLKGKAFNIAIIALLTLTLCMYVQAMFLNENLPVADGATLDLINRKTVIVWTSAIWAAIIAGIVFATKRSATLTRFGLCAVALALIIVQSAAVVSLVANPEASRNATSDGELHVTEEGLYSLSDKHNIVVFCVDTLDVQFLDEAWEADPTLLDEMGGFTYFRNSTAIMIPTRYGVPYLLTGKSLLDYRENGGVDADIYYYYDARWRDSHFLDDIENAGYSIGIYTDSIMNKLDVCADKTINIHSLADVNVKNSGIVKVAVKIALYRDMPWILKLPFWYSTNELNDAMADRDEETADLSTAYVMNDAQYYASMKERPLTVTEEGEAGAFRFIHLEGAHYPFVMDENCVVTGASNLVSQTRGSMRIVSEYLHQMKEAGVYDSATIIITADHGYWYTALDINEPTTAVMLVKPAGADSSVPVALDNSPTGHLDYPATVIDAAGADSSAYGMTVWEAAATYDIDSDRPRYYLSTISDGGEKWGDIGFKEWVVNGDALDWNDWSATGRVWEWTREGQ